MKKITILILCLLIFLGTSGCKSTIETVATTKNEEATTILTTTTTKNTTSVEKNTKSLPKYTPGSIKLDPGEDFCDEDAAYFKRHYRVLYYAIPSPIDQLADHGVSEFFEKISVEADGKEIHEMLLVTFVKQFKISKSDFEKSVVEVKTIYQSSGFDLADERFELPNADIIYTFDNEIINEYYRRE